MRFQMEKLSLAKYQQMKVIFCWKQTKTETGKIIRRRIKPVYHICLTLICKTMLG